MNPSRSPRPATIIIILLLVGVLYALVWYSVGMRELRSAQAEAREAQARSAAAQAEVIARGIRIDYLEELLLRYFGVKAKEELPTPTPNLESPNEAN